MALSFGCWLVQDLEQIFVTLEGIGNERPESISAIEISPIDIPAHASRLAKRRT
jgi:hypothetical protein